MHYSNIKLCFHMHNDRDNAGVKEKHFKIGYGIIISMKVYYHIHLIDFM